VAEEKEKSGVEAMVVREAVFLAVEEALVRQDLECLDSVVIISKE